MPEDPSGFNVEVPMRFGGRDVILKPIPGIKRQQEFARAMRREIEEFRRRVAEIASDQHPVAAMLADEADIPSLLQIADPELFTEELLDSSTRPEQFAAIQLICLQNRWEAYASFFDRGHLIEISMRLQRPLPDFPSPASSIDSSEPVSAGSPSSTS